jgi:glycosyltransferase involved in cell wall biosynthesis
MVQKNLESIFMQKYQNLKVIYIDDCSTDNTGLLVQEYIKEQGFQDRCIVLRNTQRVFKMANLYRAYHLCSDDMIIVELDGDDWFAHDDVLLLINKIYSEHDVWVTCGHYMQWPGSITSQSLDNVRSQIPQDIIDNNAYRKMSGGYVVWPTDLLCMAC